MSPLVTIHLFVFWERFVMKYANARILDKVKEYDRTGRITASSFMDPGEMLEASSALRNVEHVSFGGYEGAERKMIFIGVSQEDVELFKSVEVFDFICVIRIIPNANVSASSGMGTVRLSHRSVLGSVLGLGVKREMIGDILIGEKSCDMIVAKPITDFLQNNLRFVGREKVTVKVLAITELQEVQENEKEIAASVSSLRLDAVISAGFGIAREKSNALVKAEMVKLNHVLVKSPVKAVSEGDVISVRGKGRLVLKEVSGHTRSERTRIILVRK